MKKAYRDKLSGIIDEGFWRENAKEWSAEEVKLESALQRASTAASTNQTPAVTKILELAQLAHSVILC